MPEGFIYIIDEGNDDSPIKIGSSCRRSLDRVNGLQTGNPRPLRLVYEEAAEISLERVIHSALDAHRLCGEWFERTPEVRRFLMITAQLGYEVALEDVRAAIRAASTASLSESYDWGTQTVTE
jgi:hypothetical protein